MNAQDEMRENADAESRDDHARNLVDDAHDAVVDMAVKQAGDGGEREPPEGRA